MIYNNERNVSTEYTNTRLIKQDITRRDALNAYFLIFYFFLEVFIEYVYLRSEAKKGCSEKSCQD